jgi:hypothetical protein
MPTFLPPFDEVHIPQLGVVLVDDAHAGLPMQDRARRIQRRVSKEMFERVRPSQTLCPIPEPGVPVENDSDEDLELGTKTFVVRNSTAGGNYVLGSFILYNVEIVKAGPVAEISAMALPACRPAEGKTVRQTWSGIMRWMLENDFTHGPFTTDLVEWRFPTKEGHRWVLSPQEILAGAIPLTAAATPTRAVADLEDHEETRRLDYPVKIRRRRAERT